MRIAGIAFAWGILSLALHGQTPSAIVAPRADAMNVSPSGQTASTRAAIAAAVPVLGYVPGPGPAEIRPILGTARKPQLGSPVAAPQGTTRVYLPPRQHYALLENSSSQTILIANTTRAASTGTRMEASAIPGTIAHPSLIAFSPRGDTAVLYDQRRNRMQVIGPLPAGASVRHEISTANIGEIQELAVSDDGELMVARGSNGALVTLTHDNSTTWSAPFEPRAWSFVPNRHDLVISVTAQHALVLLPNVTEAPRTLATEVEADRLAMTKDGSQLLAADSATGRVWKIDLQSGALKQSASANADFVSCLRDGLTFLISGGGTFSLLTAANDAITAQLSH